MEITSLSLEEQDKVITGIVKDLQDQDIEVKKKTSRYQSKYKALEVATNADLKTFFSTYGYSVDVAEADPTIQKIISGRYKAVIITIKSGQLKNKEFYCVNSYTEKGTIKKKQLSPQTLGLDKQKYTSTDMFDNAVTKCIEQLKIDDPAKKFMRSVFDLAKSGSSKIVSFDEKTKNAYSLVKPQDIQAIGTDFGEVVSLRWVVNQKEYSGFKYFYFSDVPNEPLVDYVVVLVFNDHEVKMEFSAKYGAGAAPALSGILKHIPKAYPKPTAKEKPILGVLNTLAVKQAGKTISDNILEACKILKHPGYVSLEKIIKKKNLTLEDITQFISHYITNPKNVKTSAARIKLFNQYFAEFYSTIDKTVENASLETVFKTNHYSKVFSPLISPLGYSLVGYMNNDPVFSEVLNNVAREVEVQQVYLNFTSTNMAFKIKQFSDAKFSFDYGANAKDSGNTGIKFRMMIPGEATQEIEKK